MNLRISVIGTGYLGTTHAACLAELGFDVLAVDRDPAKIASLSRGVVPFAEPGLQDLVARHTASGRLRFTTDLRRAARFADVHFICVGTPQSRTGLEADVSAVHAVARGLAADATRDCLIVGKSTVPVGTAARLAEDVAACLAPGLTAAVAWNPEFLREGHGVEDTLRPDRLVFGVSTPDAELTLRRVYEQPIAAGVPVHVTDTGTAELAKVAANAFLATKISFINAMAEVSDLAGTDVVALADILGDDPRIGRRFLDAGIGFGGGCLPKDIRAFSARAVELGARSVAGLLLEVDDINRRARERTVDLARRMCGARLWGRRVAVLGAAFKPFSDDVRDSPALDVAHQLHAEGAAVCVYDPEANDNARAVFPSSAVRRQRRGSPCQGRPGAPAHRLAGVHRAGSTPGGRAGAAALHHRRPEPARPGPVADGGMDHPGCRSRLTAGRPRRRLGGGGSAKGPEPQPAREGVMAGGGSRRLLARRLVLTGGGVILGVGLSSGAAAQVVRVQARITRRAIGKPLGEDAHMADRVYKKKYGAPIDLLLLGDSIAAGLGAEKPKHTLGAQLARRTARDTRRAVRLHTAAYVGSETSMLRAQLAALPAGYRADVAVIVVGGNDVTHRVKTSESVRHLREAVTSLQGRRDRGGGGHLPGPRCPHRGAATAQDVGPGGVPPARHGATRPGPRARGTGGLALPRGRSVLRHPARGDVRGRPVPPLERRLQAHREGDAAQRAGSPRLRRRVADGALRPGHHGQLSSGTVRTTGARMVD